MYFCTGFTSLGFAKADVSALPSFSMHKHESNDPGKTILVIGGFQGDEPGGFHAASLLITYYKR